jgi:hypothetical protein
MWRDPQLLNVLIVSVGGLVLLAGFFSADYDQ